VTHVTRNGSAIDGSVPRRRASVLLADDHPIMAQGLRLVLEPEFEIVGIVGDGQALVAAAKDLRPDVIVADVSMPILSGIQAARLIRDVDQHVAIVFLSMHPDATYASEALRVGAAAYVLKSSPGTEIAAAVRKAVDGRVDGASSQDRWLVDARLEARSPGEIVPTIPPRQRQVLQMVAAGRSTKQIAESLSISPRTVEFHRYRVMQSLGLHTIAELVQYAIRHRLILL
jgi:DNA-binding NarL/FixJ family response regulator